MRVLALLSGVALMTLSGPTFAQDGPHAGHGTSSAPAAADPSCPPEHAAMGHCTPAAQQPAADPHAGHTMPATPPAATEPAAAPSAAPRAQPTAPASDAHAGHDMSAPPPAADPHAGHGTVPPPPEAAADPHAGHNMPAADPHAGHAAGGAPEAAPIPPVTAPPTAAFGGPRHAADTVFGAAAMASAREQLRREHGAITGYNVLLDQVEARIVDGRDGYFINGQAWYGGDIDRLWLKTEIESDFGRAPEQAEVQALWSRAIDPWFNLQTGVRYDFQPNPERAHFVLGIQGLAPYWFEVDGALFLSEKGDVTARFEAEYDQRITQRLILQPRVEIDFALQDVPERGVGSGLSKVEAGLRLRYEIAREFAPYVGVEYNETFGDTADFERAEAGDVSHFSFVFGVRAWF